jgi:hypothetical protein
MHSTVVAIVTDFVDSGFTHQVAALVNLAVAASS